MAALDGPNPTARRSTDATAPFEVKFEASGPSHEEAYAFALVLNVESIALY
jgi:hypothetical protein